MFSLPVMIAYSNQIVPISAIHDTDDLLLRDAPQSSVTRRSSIPPTYQPARLELALPGLPRISSSISLDSSTMVSGRWPFSCNAYLSACARFTNRPPKIPFCSRATQLPRRFLPTKTVDAAGQHEGALTNFIITILPQARKVCSSANTAESTPVGRWSPQAPNVQRALLRAFT